MVWIREDTDMARQKAFDPDQVLEKAMRAFWAKGYEATSVEDLVAATGINRASLYGTFGDKKRIFLSALDRYVAAGEVARADVETAGAGVRETLLGLFERLIRRAREGREAGCLLTNSVAEFGARDPEILEALRRSLAAMENGVDGLLRRGIRTGEVPPDADPRARARMVIAAMQGFQVISKVNADPRALRQIAEEAVDAALR
jgi:TetR/AcrR family transcriptional repressor of nem operon